MRIIIAGMVAIGLTATPTSAQTTQTFDACYVPEVGAIYLIGLPGLPTECLSAEHEPISWTEGGDVGDGSITTAKLADNAVTTAKLAPGSVSSAVISDEAVSASKLANAAVTTAKIADGVVTGSHVVEGTLTAADLAAGSVGSAELIDGGVSTADLENGAVTTAKIGADVAIPPSNCSLDQIIQWNGSSWVCAEPTGISGLETVSSTAVRERIDNSIYSETFSAVCPTGKQALGGGYTLVDPSGRVFPIEDNRPAGSSWQVTLEWQLSFPGESFQITVYAVCALAGA